MSTTLKYVLAVFIVNFCLCLVSCAKILAVFPTPSISHQVVFRPLIHELVKRGHEVTVITTDPIFPKEKAPSNLIEIDVHEISYKIWGDTFQNDTVLSKDDTSSQIEIIMRLITKVFTAQLANEEIQNIINKKKGHFDLLFLEAYVKSIMIFTHIYKVPVIQVSSLGGLHFNYDVVGASTHPLLYPTFEHKRLYNLSNIEKLQQLYNQWQIKRSVDLIEQDDNELLQKLFGKGIPPIRELYNNVQMLFLNSHPLWTNNQPVPPNVVYIGGIHTRPSKKLPKDLESLLTASKNGVIYFSLGTNVRPSVLAPAIIQMMIKVFSQLPYDVIWKWDQDSMPGKTENIKLYKWLPQSDLLRHPKVKLFITQGGVQSSEEAIEAAVPLIGVPLLVDQWYNTEKYAHHKIGLNLDLSSLTEEKFIEAIETVITDTSYRENIKRLRSIMKDEPQTPLERAVWWTEYVLRHGGAKHLRAAGANISWAQYLELELITIVISVLCFILLLLLLCLKLLGRIILRTINYKLKIS